MSCDVEKIIVSFQTDTNPNPICIELSFAKMCRFVCRCNEYFLERKDSASAFVHRKYSF